jgi:hypothetical protein
MTRYVFVFALCGVASLAMLPLAAAKKVDEADEKKHDDKKGKEAKKFTAAEGWLKSLPRGPELKSTKPLQEAVRTAGYGWYNNVGVNLNTTLTDTVGSTAVSVYAADIRWRYAFGSSPDVTSPTGDGGTGGAGWQFPNAHRFGIVVFQGSNYWNVESTDPANPTKITGLSNTTPIVVSVNDTNGNYGDNSGSFDLYVRKDN